MVLEAKEKNEVELISSKGNKERSVDQDSDSSEEITSFESFTL